MLARYYVVATERDRVCDRNSAIKRLEIDQEFNGSIFHDVGNLKSLADTGQLWVKPLFGQPAKVRVFWSSIHRRWIGTTNADDTVCNNLLALRMVFSIRESNGLTRIQECVLSR